MAIITEFLKSFVFSKLLRRFELTSDLEVFEALHSEIERGSSFRGMRLWILIFAIVIASVGLNINSTAIIIGAMLISPLMGPIIGMGYSLATYDFRLYRKAIINFGAACGCGLAASALYFSLSPLNAVHSELLARTTPSIYDVIIAFFGGLAGIVAVTSKRKENVVPGVAIATALMPPLCTAGYGLATLHWSYFFGALYLFTINTVFIGLATLLTTRLLPIPILATIDSKRMATANRWVSVIVIATVIPSIYFGYLLVAQERFRQHASEFISKETFIEGDYLLKSDINPTTREVKLIFGGKAISDSLKALISSKRNEYGLDNATIVIQQGFSIADIGLKANMLEPEEQKLTILQTELLKERTHIDSLAAESKKEEDILKQIKALFPFIRYGVISPATEYSMDSTTVTHQILIVRLTMKKQDSKHLDKKQLLSWLAVRYPKQTIELLIEDETNK